MNNYSPVDSRRCSIAGAKPAGGAINNGGVMLIPELKPGDIFLSRNPMALGVIINAVQRFWSTDNKSEYSHAGIITGANGNTFESLWTVKNQNIHVDYLGEKILIARHKRMTYQKYRSAAMCIQKHSGQWYPSWRLIFMIVPPVSKYLSFGRVVCSELVCKFLAATGLYDHMVWAGKNPDHIADMVKKWGDWEIVFEGVVGQVETKNSSVNTDK